jgi:hypothetical protein
MIPEEGTARNFKRAVLAQDVDKNYIMDLVRQHEESTGFCSLAGHMRHCSTTYAEIMQYGRMALPGIFQWMYNKRVNHCYSSMAVMLLLMDIVKESPYKPEVEGGFAKYTVADADDAWLAWGYEHGHLNKTECPLIPIERKKWVNPMPAVERFLGVKQESRWRRLLFWRSR